MYTIKTFLKICKSISQAASGCRAGKDNVDQCSAGQLQTMHLIEQPLGDPSVSCTSCCCDALCAAPSQLSMSFKICCCAAPFASPSQPSVSCTMCCCTAPCAAPSKPSVSCTMFYCAEPCASKSQPSVLHNVLLCCTTRSIT